MSLSPAQLADALAKITAAIMPPKTIERKPLPPGIAAKLEIRTAAHQAEAAKAALPAIVDAPAPGRAAVVPAHGKAPDVLKVQTPSARPPVVVPDISIAHKVDVVGDVIRIQLSPTPENVRAVKAGHVPPAAALALSKAAAAYPGAPVEVYGGKTRVASSPEASPPPVVAPVVVPAPAAPAGGG